MAQSPDIPEVFADFSTSVVTIGHIDVPPAAFAAGPRTQSIADDNASEVASNAIAWQADSTGPNGDWGDSGHWVGGFIPGNADTVEIGPGISTEAPWTVTATSETAAALVLASEAASLAITGTLGILGSLTLASGDLLSTSGATVSVGASVDVSGSSTLDGLTLVSLGTDTLTGAVLMQPSALWRDASLSIAGGSLSLMAASSAEIARLADSGGLNLTRGTLTIGDGASVSAASMVLQSDATVAVAATGSLFVGQVASPTSGLVIGANADASVDASSTLNVAGTLTLMGGMLSLAAGANVSEAALVLNDGSVSAGLGDAGTLALDGATLTDGGLMVEGAASAALLAGAQWTTRSVLIGYENPNNYYGYPSAGALTLSGDGTEGSSRLTITDNLVLGHSPGPAPTNFGTPGVGSLVAEDGVAVAAANMSILNSSSLSLDATSSVVLASASASAGALTVGADATLSSDIGSITGNFILLGGLRLFAFLPAGSGGPDPATLKVSGDMTADSIVTLNALTTLSVGGGLSMGSSGDIVVAGGALLVAGSYAGAGLVTLANGGSATLDALGGPATIDFADGTGLLDVAGSGAINLTLLNLQAGDSIDLVSLSSTPSPTFVEAGAETDGSSLDVTAASGEAASLAIGGTTPNLSFATRSDGQGGTVIVSSAAPCYVAGTLIATVCGEVAVEALAPGDRVVTQEGRLAPVRWVGRRDVDCRHHPWSDQVLPVRIAAGAFAPGRPRRDLWLSPDHAVFVYDALIPIRYLVNGATIAVQPVARVSYLHIELDRHEVILAEGLPAESYLDTGNRAAFATGGGAMQLHPDFARRVWQDEGCAPLVLAGPRLAAARRGLFARAGELGFRITRDPGLALFTDGRRLAADVEGSRWKVRLPRVATRLLIRSHSWVPTQMEAEADDCRTLGVALGSLTLNGRNVALDSPALADGWHAPEADGRWTDGAATLPTIGVTDVAFTLAMRGHYWTAASKRASRWA